MSDDGPFVPDFIQEFREDIGEGDVEGPVIESHGRQDLEESRGEIQERIDTIGREQGASELVRFKTEMLRRAQVGDKENFEEEEIDAIVAAATALWKLIVTDTLPIEELKDCEKKCDTLRATQASEG